MSLLSRARASAGTAEAAWSAESRQARSDAQAGDSTGRAVADRFHQVESGTFRCDGWESGPVLVADTFCRTMEGLETSAGRTRACSSGAVGARLRDEGAVAGRRPGRSGTCCRDSGPASPATCIWIRGARHILELPIDAAAAAAGGGPNVGRVAGRLILCATPIGNLE